MELALFVYSVSVVSKIGVLCGVVMGVLLVCCLLKTMNAAFNVGDYDRKYRPEVYQKNMETLKFKWVKMPAVVVISLGILSSLIPSEKTMYTALAAYAAQSMVQSETADKVLKIVNGKLDEYLVDMESLLKKELNDEIHNPRNLLQFK